MKRRLIVAAIALAVVVLVVLVQVDRRSSKQPESAAWQDIAAFESPERETAYVSVPSDPDRVDEPAPVADDCQRN